MDKRLPGVPAILAILATFLARGSALAGTTSDDLPQRYRAAIIVEQAAPFVRLPLSPQVYANSRSAGLADLRILDAGGERVPFALLAPRPEQTTTRQQWRAAVLYRLPPRPASGEWLAPVDLTLADGRLTLRQRGGPPIAAERSPGWLVDLGERAPGEAAPRALRFEWTGPSEFSAPYQLETSADLRTWRAAGSGQLIALAAASGALTQPDAPLPESVERFVRIVWRPEAAPPELRAAHAGHADEQHTTLDPATSLVLASSPEPASAYAGEDARRALHFDLAARLPVATLELLLPAGTRVLPVRVQARQRLDEPWQTITSTVVYRLERAGGVAADRSPPLVVRRDLRYVRALPDARATAPAAGEVRLEVRADLASVVFAAQGTPPYTLATGAERASPGALPLPTLVPEADKERVRFGVARLGTFAELPEAAQQDKTDARNAALRPWLLWGVLLAGVVLLAVMVWRLARARGGAPPN